MRAFAWGFFALLTGLTAGGVALGQTKPTGGPIPSPEGALVYFIDLKDGATIAPKATIHFGLHGMGIAPAGSDKANSGHHHLLIDTDLPPLDEPIPSDFNHMHFGAGQTEVDLELPPGPHTLQLLLGDKNHVPHTPPVMSERIHVTVAQTPPAATAAAPVAPAKPAAYERRPSPAGAKVYFVSPTNGAAVPSTFLVRFGLDNMGIARAGVDTPNTGHHHLLIDAPLPPFDAPIDNDENHLHFGAGQTETTITLTPGKHTLQLLLGDANHVPHDPPVFSEPIQVTVGAAPQTAAAPVAPPKSSAYERRPSPAGAKVYFVSPTNGAAVPPTFQVRFGLDNMGLARAGVDTPNTGHHHLLIDTPLPSFDEPIDNDENHLHFGAGQTEATVTLTPGKHTLQLLLGDANHVPHNPPVFSEPIQVTVGAAPQTAAAPVAPAKPAAYERRPSPAGAKVYFVSPKNGAAVPLTFLVRFGLDNMGLARAGVDTANTGHHHLLIDAPLPPFGEPIDNDENHLHFGAGQTETTITLTPGKHTLQLLLGDANHVPHDPPVFSEPITVIAGEAPKLKICKPNETVDSSGACVAHEAAQPVPKPIRHSEVATRPRREVPPDRVSLRPQLPIRPQPKPASVDHAASDAGQAFRDPRGCPPGTHSHSSPWGGGFHCDPD